MNITNEGLQGTAKVPVSPKPKVVNIPLDVSAQNGRHIVRTTEIFMGTTRTGNYIFLMKHCQGYRKTISGGYVDSYGTLIRPFVYGPMEEAFFRKHRIELNRISRKVYNDYTAHWLVAERWLIEYPLTDLRIFRVRENERDAKAVYYIRNLRLPISANPNKKVERLSKLTDEMKKVLSVYIKKYAPIDRWRYERPKKTEHKNVSA